MYSTATLPFHHLCSVPWRTHPLTLAGAAVCMASLWVAVEAKPGLRNRQRWWFGFCQVIFKLGEFLYHSYRAATSAFVLAELREWCILGLPPRICLMKPQHVPGGKGLPTQN